VNGGVATIISPLARQPTTIRYVDTKHIYESLMWDQALDRRNIDLSVVLRIRNQGSACQVP